MTDDLIKRSDAVKEIAKHLGVPAANWLKEAEKWMSGVPSAEPEQRWIPCSEKLPERGVSVLLSHVGYVSEDYLDIDDGAMYFWNSGIDLDEELKNLAWLPLPEPWKGEADGHD